MRIVPSKDIGELGSIELHYVDQNKSQLNGKITYSRDCFCCRSLEEARNIVKRLKVGEWRSDDETLKSHGVHKRTVSTRIVRLMEKTVSDELKDNEGY